MDNLSSYINNNQSAVIPRNNFFNLFPIDLSVADNFQLANEYINKDLNIYSAVSQETSTEMDTLISQSNSTVAQQAPIIMAPAVKVNSAKPTGSSAVPRKRKLQDVVDNIVEQTILADTQPAAVNLIVSQEPAVAMISSVQEEVPAVVKPIAKKRKPAVKKPAEPMDTSAAAAAVPETIKEKKPRKPAVRKTTTAKQGENVAAATTSSSSDSSGSDETVPAATPVTKPKRKSVKKPKTDEVTGDVADEKPIAKKRKVSPAKKDSSEEKNVKKRNLGDQDLTPPPTTNDGEHTHLTFREGAAAIFVTRRLQMKRTLTYTLKIELAEEPIIFIPEFSKKFNMLFSFCPILKHMVATVHVLEDCYLEIGQSCASC